MHHRFIWADLSSYDVAAAERFYGGVFGWHFADSDIGGYRLAMLGGALVAAVHPMPDKFARINMPPFWMPYIAVASAAKAATKAGECGGKVELLEHFGGGEVALIRDPSGAGFSVYDGGDIASSAAAGIDDNGLIAGYELFVPDAKVVGDFYKGVFGWHLLAKGGGRFAMTDKSGADTIDKSGADNADNNDNKYDNCAAMVQESSDDSRGNKQYWAVHFAVDSLAKAKAKVQEHGGQVWDEHNKNQCFATSPANDFFILSAARS